MLLALSQPPPGDDATLRAALRVAVPEFSGG
jgi:hypothetical protein